MTKYYSTILCLFFTLSVFAQEKATDTTELKSNWNNSGKFTFLGNQSSYSYWTAGGQTSLSGTIKIDYDFNFENNGWNWDTKVITAYGINSIGGSKYLKKTDDRLEVNSLLGKKFTNGFIRNGHDVLEISDRDFLRNNKSFSLIPNKNNFQKFLIDTFKNYNPDIVFFGHTKNIELNTLDTLKSINKNLIFISKFNTFNFI